MVDMIMLLKINQALNGFEWNFVGGGFFLIPFILKSNDFEGKFDGP